MDFKNFASNLTSIAFNSQSLAPRATPPASPVSPTSGATAADAAAPKPADAAAPRSADASNIKASGAAATLGLMEAARGKIVGDFRGMFGDIVRSNARLETANQALGNALRSGDSAAIRSATEGLKSAMSDLQTQLQRLPGEVAKMKTLPRGVKDAYTAHLQEIQRIAEGVANIGADAKPASGVQAGGNQAATPGGQQPAEAASPVKPQAQAQTAPDQSEQVKENEAVKGNGKRLKLMRRFDKLDGNNDGVLSPEEIGGRRKFSRLDTDGDGKVSREELLGRFRKGAPAARPADGQVVPAPANPPAPVVAPAVQPAKEPLF